MERQRPFLEVRDTKEDNGERRRREDQKLELLYLFPTMRTVYDSLSDEVDRGG